VKVGTLIERLCCGDDMRITVNEECEKDYSFSLPHNSDRKQDMCN
jgi:hypothetical protein